MILPTKHISTQRSLLGIGAEILEELEEPKTVSTLWNDIQNRRRESPNRLPFDWFVLALNFLYSLDTIELRRGRLSRRLRGEE